MEMQLLTPDRLNHVLDELRRRFEALYGPRLMRLVLYGSQARGDAAPGSDVDVLVVLAGPVRPAREIERASEIVAEISLKHDVVISCVYVSAEAWAEEMSPFMLNVRREGMPI